MWDHRYRGILVQDTEQPKTAGITRWEVERSKALIAKDGQQGLLRKMNGKRKH